MNDNDNLSTHLMDEVLPTDSPDSEMAKIIQEESPDAIVLRLEKAAELAPRYRAAMRTILISLTYPGDWEIFGDGDKAKVCLGSAGAERVGTQFPIQFYEVKNKKESSVDSIGPMYRYVYTGKATMGGRVVFAQGIYSTRDKFLGFARDEYKPLEQINENDIQTAAYHRFLGNGIKALLGLRAMPLEQYQELMQKSKQNGTNTSGHTYASGSQGGSTKDDTARRRELVDICIDLANAGMTIENDELVPNENAEVIDNIASAQYICEQLSSFTGKTGDIVLGCGAKKLAGKRLEITLNKARKIREGMDK